MKFKVFIKVPLVLTENIFFSFFPSLRPLIERYIFNPLDFKNNHIEYSKKKFDEFQQRTPIAADLRERTILELGPGGSLGFGLLALEAGAKKYLAVDDGIHTFIEKKQLLQYKALLKNSQTLRTYFYPIKKGFSYNTNLIEYVAIDQTSKYPLPDNSIDIIYSCAVLEHVHDLDLCFSEMARVLKNDGILYHEVDLRDHIFSQESLWFLTISDFWFRLLFSHTGGFVNRKRISYYKKLAQKYHLSVVSFEPIVKYEGPISLKKIQVAAYADEDIRTLAFYIVLKKNHV